MSTDTHTDICTSASVDDVGKRPMVRRTLFVPKKTWDAAKARADEEETNVSEVVRKALERYAKGKK